MKKIRIWKNNNKVILLSFYVDYMLLASNYQDMMNKTKIIIWNLYMK